MVKHVHESVTFSSETEHKILHKTQNHCKNKIYFFIIFSSLLVFNCLCFPASNYCVYIYIHIYIYIYILAKWLEGSFRMAKMFFITIMWADCSSSLMHRMQIKYSAFRTPFKSDLQPLCCTGSSPRLKTVDSDFTANCELLTMCTRSCSSSDRSCPVSWLEDV